MIKGQSFDLVTRDLKVLDRKKITVDLNNPVYRYPHNPILTSEVVNKIWTNPALQVRTVHNAGVTKYNDEYIMMFRSHLSGGVSVLGLAKSKNGIDGWKVQPRLAMSPCAVNESFADGVNKGLLIENESGGVEDPRIIKMGDEYAITYSAYNPRTKNKVRISLAVTKDFQTFTRLGPIMNTNMRNVVIFPEKINGRYVALFRLNDTSSNDTGGKFTEIRIGYSDDWKSNKWKLMPDPIIKTGGGPSAFSDKIGPGAPLIKTKSGWLNIFHGVRKTMAGNPYVLGVALHDLNDPAKVKISNIPILFPSAADCRVKEDAYVHVPQVVFTCGAIRKDDGTIIIYYGGCDTVMNVGITHEDILISLCENYGQDPLTGQKLFISC